MKTEMVKAKLNGRYTMILPKHRADRPEWYSADGWEKARMEKMHEEINSEKMLGKNPLIYYVGVEMGEMTALCQMWGAKVVMFEPNPLAWPSIKAIWDANKLEFPLGIFPGFASDETDSPKNLEYTEKYLHIGSDGWPVCVHAEIEEAHGFKELDKESESFPQITIDDMVQVSQNFPTMISLDVEGAEGMVLKGAEATLRAYHPKIFLSGHPEFLHDNFEGKAGFEYLRDLRDWLKEIGYKEEILDYQHEVHLFYHA